MKVALSPDAQMLLALDDLEIFGLSVRDGRVLKQAKRGLYAAPVLWSATHRSIRGVPWALTHYPTHMPAAFPCWGLRDGAECQNK